MEDMILFLLTLFVVFALRIAIVVLVICGSALILLLLCLVGVLIWSGCKASTENHSVDQFGTNTCFRPSDNAHGSQSNPPPMLSPKPERKYWYVN